MRGVSMVGPGCLDVAEKRRISAVFWSVAQKQRPNGSLLALSGKGNSSPVAALGAGFFKRLTGVVDGVAERFCLSETEGRAYV